MLSEILLFVIFINDLVDVCKENIKMHLFADNAKMYFHIKNVADKNKLQRVIKNFVDWTSKWQVSLNINKCKIISVHHKRYSNMGVAPNYVMNNILFKEVEEIKDLGVFDDSLLVLYKHICKKNK